MDKVIEAEVLQSKRRKTILDILAIIAVLAAAVFFISDLIFRRFIPSAKKLWVVEGVLVIFIVILVFIIKSSIS